MRAAQALTLAEARATLEPAIQGLEGTLDWYCVEYWSRELGLDILGLTRAGQRAHRLAARARKTSCSGCARRASAWCC